MTEQDFQEYVIAEFKDLKERLFRDNGRISHQSKINTNSLYIKWLAAIFSAVGISFLGFFIFLLKKQLGD